MSTPKKIPITRNNKFFSREDFELEVEMGREAIEGDLNFRVILYRVDRTETTSDDIYEEAAVDEIRFFPPVELNVVPIMAAPENKNYAKGQLRYLEDGKLTFGIYEAHILELDVEIGYGDYIGYPVTEDEVRFFAVTNDGVKNYDNNHTIMGWKGAFRTVECAPVDEDEFKGV